MIWLIFGNIWKNWATVYSPSGHTAYKNEQKSVATSKRRRFVQNEMRRRNMFRQIQFPVLSYFRNCSTYTKSEVWFPLWRSARRRCQPRTRTSPCDASSPPSWRRSYPRRRSRQPEVDRSVSATWSWGLDFRWPCTWGPLWCLIVRRSFDLKGRGAKLEELKRERGSFLIQNVLLRQIFCFLYSVTRFGEISSLWQNFKRLWLI